MRLRWARLKQEVARHLEEAVRLKEEMRRAPVTFGKIRKDWEDLARHTQSTADNNPPLIRQGKLAYIAQRVDECTKRVEEAEGYYERCLKRVGGGVFSFS